MTKLSILIASCLVACGGSAPIPDRETPPLHDEPATTRAGGGEGTQSLVEQLPAAVVVSDQLVLGGQPDEAALRQAHAEGYRTIITLRADGEPNTEGERELVQSLGMRFVQIPVDRETGLNPDNAHALDEALSDPETGRAVLHCGSGNRAAALLALRDFVKDGLTIEQTLARLSELGLTRLEIELRAVLTELCEAAPGRSC